MDAIPGKSAGSCAGDPDVAETPTDCETESTILVPKSSPLPTASTRDVADAGESATLVLSTGSAALLLGCLWDERRTGLFPFPLSIDITLYVIAGGTTAALAWPR